MGHQFNSEIVKWQTDNYYIITLIRPHQFNFFFVRHLMKKARGVERLNGKIIILGVHKSIKFERTIIYIFFLVFSDFKFNSICKVLFKQERSGSTSKKLNYGGLTLVVQKKILFFIVRMLRKGIGYAQYQILWGMKKHQKVKKRLNFKI